MTGIIQTCAIACGFGGLFVGSLRCVILGVVAFLAAPVIWGRRHG